MQHDTTVCKTVQYNYLIQYNATACETKQCYCIWYNTGRLYVEQNNIAVIALYPGLVPVRQCIGFILPFRRLNFVRLTFILSSKCFNIFDYIFHFVKIYISSTVCIWYNTVLMTILLIMMRSITIIFIITASIFIFPNSQRSVNRRHG